jgi:ABA4-like protein
MTMPDPATIFTIANDGIIPFWLLLFLAPNWRGTHILVHSALIPVVLGMTYIWVLGSAILFGHAPPGSGFSSLAGVMALFSSPVAMTGGWIHYLVFDLFVGAWITRDAHRRGLSHFAVMPILIVTLLFGPAGLLLYLITRALFGKGGFPLDEKPA